MSNQSWILGEIGWRLDLNNVVWIKKGGKMVL